MADQKEFKFGKVNPWVFLVGIVLIIAMLFWVAKKIFALLYWASPVIIIAALIIDYKVVLGFVKWIIDTVQRNPIVGIAAILFTVVGFPLVATFLLIRALAGSKFAEAKKKFDKYEEVDDDFLDLSEVKEYEKRVDKGLKDLGA